MNSKEILKIACKVELAKRYFYYFCKIMIPKMYNDEHPYLKKLCDDLQNFWENDDKKYFCLSLPPRHGKSLTIGLFVNWLLGKNKDTKIMTGSYNEDFASDMSKVIRNRIQEKKEQEDIIVFSDIFESKIEKGSAQAKKFKLKGSIGTNVLSTSLNGSATGMGCSLLILDDMLRSASESYSIKQKDKIYDWFVNTMLSRLEGEKKKIVLIGTRWCKDDLIGRIIDEDKENCVVINIPVIDEENNLLCESIFNYEDYKEIKKKMSEEIFSANFLGIPLDLKDRMYHNINEYEYINGNFYIKRDNPVEKDGKVIDKEKIEDKDGRVIAYVDTADTGKDYLCCIIAKILKNKIFILDIYYTKDIMEITEKIVAEKLTKFKVINVLVESNNGGRGWARNVSRYLLEMGNKFTQIQTFTQTKGKDERIFSNARNIENYVYFPFRWDNIFTEAFKSMVQYKATSQNEHDDFEDCLTGLFEMFEKMGYTVY